MNLINKGVINDAETEKIRTGSFDNTRLGKVGERLINLLPEEYKVAHNPISIGKGIVELLKSNTTRIGSTTPTSGSKVKIIKLDTKDLKKLKEKASKRLVRTSKSSQILDQLMIDDN